VKSVLASIPSPTINDIQVGPFQIRFYALFIILGIVLAILVSAMRMKARGAKAGVALDIAIWAVPFGIVGGRIFHVLTHVSDYFGPGANPVSSLYIWEGGLAIYGALIFGALGAWLGARSSGIKLMAYADILVPGLILAQGIGRWGNYFNSELFGTPTTLPWGLQIDATNPAWPVGLPAGTLMHPTFLYESLWDLAGVAVLLFVEKRFRLQWGKLFAVYLMYYSLGRAIVEPMRLDPAYIFLGLRANEWSAILGIILGLVVFLVQKQKHPGVETSIFLPGRDPRFLIEDEAEFEGDSDEYVVADAQPDADEKAK
jgi:prolipoprotein diacylglyceryl transferase